MTTTTSPAVGASLLVLTSVGADHPVLTSSIRDWADQEQVHKALMRLFPTHLDGEPRHHRANAGILYRLEYTPDGRPRILIQHACPLRTTQGVQTLPLQPLLDHLQPGVLIRFRVVLNAVTTTNHTNRRTPIVNTLIAANQPIPADLGDADLREDPDGTRTVDRLTPHLRRKLGDALTAITVPDEPTVTVRRIGQIPLHTVRYDGHATITDPHRLREHLTRGIGRAKAYGCGMLSLAPARPER